MMQTVLPWVTFTLIVALTVILWKTHKLRQQRDKAQNEINERQNEVNERQNKSNERQNEINESQLQVSAIHAKRIEELTMQTEALVRLFVEIKQAQLENRVPAGETSQEDRHGS